MLIKNIKFLRILIEVKPFINDCFAFILVIISHIILCEVFWVVPFVCVITLLLVEHCARLCVNTDRCICNVESNEKVVVLFTKIYNEVVNIWYYINSCFEKNKQKVLVLNNFRVCGSVAGAFLGGPALPWGGAYFVCDNRGTPMFGSIGRRYA